MTPISMDAMENPTHSEQIGLGINMKEMNIMTKAAREMAVRVVDLTNVSYGKVRVGLRW